jgi:hypothetical protein
VSSSFAKLAILTPNSFLSWRRRLCDKFQFERATDADTGLFCARGEKPEPEPCGAAVADSGPEDLRGVAGSGRSMRLVKNDFPYHTADNVEHWILWKLDRKAAAGGKHRDREGDARAEDGSRSSIAASDLETAKNDLRARLGNVLDVLHWVNPPHLKTVPELDHVHILCLRAQPPSL